MTTPIVRLEGLVAAYGGRPALHGLTLSIAAGELYGLVGPDGAGKSTAIACLAGLQPVEAGTVEVLGGAPGGHRAEVGWMPQHFTLYSDLSVAENLRFFGRLFGLSRVELNQRSQALLEATRLAPFVDRRAGALSGGMYKKLALACALLHRPQFLLLDEPTNGVDPVSRRQLWALIYGLVDEGMAMLVTTSYMDEASRCHRVGLLHRGQLLAEGAPAALAKALKWAVVEVGGAPLGELQKKFAGHSKVLIASPAGARLRLIVAPAEVPGLLAGLVEQGLQGLQVTAGFEDVFLAHAAQAEAA